MFLHQKFLKFDQLEAEKLLNMWKGKNCKIGQIVWQPTWPSGWQKEPYGRQKGAPQTPQVDLRHSAWPQCTSRLLWGFVKLLGGSGRQCVVSIGPPSLHQATCRALGPLGSSRWPLVSSMRPREASTGPLRASLGLLGASMNHLKPLGCR